MVDTANFLSEFVPIFSKYDAIIKSKRENSEYYNIFSVLNLETKEEKLHSKLIADLLNPYSMHGCGDLFLREFFKKLSNYLSSQSGDELNFGNILDNTKSVKVELEKYIGYIDKDYTQGGYIDIFMELEKRGGSKTAIIIENKIWAQDQPNQLLRYKNFAKNKNNGFDDYVILYLTLDGKVPSNYPVANDKDIKLISYKEFILPWIEECIKLVSQMPKIRETLVQYRDILLRFWGFAEVSKMSDEFISKLLEGDMLKYVCTLANYIEGAKAKIIEKLESEIEKKLENTSIYFECNISPQPFSRFSFFKDCWCYCYEFGGREYINLIESIYRNDKKKNELSRDELLYITTRFPELKLQNSLWAVCYDGVIDNINGNSLLNWSNDLFCDMNKNTRDYADYFIKRATIVFDRLEK